MFTGIVEAVGELLERRATSAGARLRIRTALAQDLSAGDSIAVNGVCLTVTSTEGGEVHADIGPETGRVTTLGWLPTGRLVNLERPLRADGRLGGHIVQGHVDGTGRIEELRQDGGFHWLTVSFPASLAPFIVCKGSIAVDGISLTVAALGSRRFDVQLVPYTMDHTNLSSVQPGDRVNLECDVIAKYVVRVAELAGLTLAGAPQGESTR
jgi:riboflavin synthase